MALSSRLELQACTWLTLSSLLKHNTTTDTFEETRIQIHLQAGSVALVLEIKVPKEHQIPRTFSMAIRNLIC